MADKVPPNALIAKLPVFRVELLRVVFTDVKDACGDRLTYMFRPDGLRNPEEENVFGATAAPEANLANAILDNFCVLRYHFATFKVMNIPQEWTKINQKKAYLIRSGMSTAHFSVSLIASPIFL
jgi:hypothetical protein